MSDLQIVTGFSILISGFARLQCGLAAYEWLFIVSLALFSCLTHLSCLIVLRNHLYDRALERLWRLLAMGALATLLVVGLLSMGNMWWDEEMFLTPGDYAICHLGFSSPLDYPFWTMLVSSMLIVIGFVSLVRLHKTLSIKPFGKARIYIKIWTRKILCPIFNSSCKLDYMQGLRRSLVYRPLLAFFLAMHFNLDGWASLIFEIGWLIVAFVWGIWCVIINLYYPRRFVEETVIFSVDRGDWTFGQIVSVTLLAAPLITIIEYFDHESNDDKTTACTFSSEITSCEPQAIHFPIVSAMNAQRDDPEDPENDWNRHPSILRTVIPYCFVACIMMSCLIVYDSGHQVSTLEIIGYFLTVFYGHLLDYTESSFFSLSIESVVSEEERRLRIFLQFVNVSFFSMSIVVGRLFAWVQCISAGFYILYTCVYKVLG